MTRRVSTALALCIALLTLAASCGDDDGDNAGGDGDGASATTSTAAAASDATASAAGPQSAEEAAAALYEAWRAEDHVAAQDVSEMDAHTKLFATPGEDADWAFQGCEAGDADRVFECAFSYEGGAASMRVALTGLYGWRVLDISFGAD